MVSYRYRRDHQNHVVQVGAISQRNLSPQHNASTSKFNMSGLFWVRLRVPSALQTLTRLSSFCKANYTSSVNITLHQLEAVHLTYCEFLFQCYSPGWTGERNTKSCYSGIHYIHMYLRSTVVTNIVLPSDAAINVRRIQVTP